MGYLENVLGPKNNLTPSKLKFFEPWSPELILRSDFCFSHFLKNFIISFFFKNILTMFIWVWLIILWTEKKTFGGCFCSKGPNVKNQFFGKKKLVKFFEIFFCQSEAVFFPDSKMVLLFEFCPNLANLWRIKVFTFENGQFPLFRSECPWHTLKGKNWSKNGTNDLYWTYNEGFWLNWAKK